MEKPFESTSGGMKIDYKRVGYRALRYWYFVVLSLVVSVTIVSAYNRYAAKIFPITASLIINEKQELGGAEFLYSNPLLNTSRNYFNEPYLIRSYPLVGNVVSKLNFDVAFYKEGKIKTTEAYNLPFKVKLLVQNGSYGASLSFKVVDQNSYSIRMIGDGNENTNSIFRFNDSVEYHGHHFAILKERSQSIERVKNESFILTFLNPVVVTGSYIGRLNVDWAEQGSGVLNLMITGSDPQKEIDFMNGLISGYQKYDLEKKNLSAERTIRFIKGQLADIADSLKIYQGRLLKFKIRNSSYGSSVDFSVGSSMSSSGGAGAAGTSSSDMSDDVATRLYGQLNLLESQRTELIIRSNYFNYLEKTIQDNKTLDLMVLPAAMGIDDVVLSGLVSQMIDLQLEVKLQSEKGLGENPRVQTGFKRIDELKGYMIDALNELRVADRFKSDVLKTKIGELEKQIDQLPLELRQFIALQRSYSLLEGLNVFLMQKMSEAAISHASNVSDISIVNPPMKGGMISPNTTRNYMLGIVFGLLLPLGFFALLEVVNQKIQSKEDIDKLANIPFIGGIWHHDSKNNLAVSIKPKSAVAESFRAIRSNLNFFTGNQVKKVFLVSSSISGEGKTFSTINLATVFAMSGRKTLIIGADMRKPKIYMDFGLDNSIGLSGYLSNLNVFSDVVQRTTIANLDLISGGTVPPNPSELLLNSRFEGLIKEALEVYDYIIIDSPPLAIVTDAFVLAKYADHTVFIVRQNYTQKVFLSDIQEYYSSGKLKNISIVLNDIYKTGLGYGYGYGKKKSGGYYEE